MLVREYINLDKNQWHNLFDRYCLRLRDAEGRKRDHLVANVRALENTLYIMGDARTGRTPTCAASVEISIWQQERNLTPETVAIMDDMLADLKLWSESETIEVSVAPSTPTEKKKSFLKIIFSK